MRLCLGIVAFFLFVGEAYAASKLILDYPRGGETFVVGTTQQIRLGAKTKVSPVTLELSRDGGQTFSLITTYEIGKGTKPGPFGFVVSLPVTGPVSGNCVIRASSEGKFAETVLSAPFSILESGTITSGSITADKISSGQASNGFVLTANGSGGSSFLALADQGPLLDSRFVNVGGDTMTGSLTLNADPTANLHSATKQYVDSANTTQDTSISGKVSRAGDTMTGSLTLSGDPTANLHAATKQYIDQPKCRIKHSTSQSLTNNSPTVLTFDSEDFDTNGLHDTTTNATRITCTKAGVYTLSACVNVTGSTGTYFLYIRLNGTTSIVGTSGPLLSSPNYSSVTTHYSLAVGDYVEVIVNQTSGTTQTVQNLSDSPVFSVVRLP